MSTAVRESPAASDALRCQVGVMLLDAAVLYLEAVETGDDRALDVAVAGLLRYARAYRKHRAEHFATILNGMGRRSTARPDGRTLHQWIQDVARAEASVRTKLLGVGEGPREWQG